MKLTRSAARLLAAVMAFVMLFALAAPASAEGDAVSVEVVLAAEGMEASGKIAISPEMVLSIGAQLLLNGECYAGLTGYAGPEAVVLESNFLNKAYGVALADLAENLKGSIFAPDSGSQFALDEDSYNSLLEILSGEFLSVSGETTVAAVSGENAGVLTDAFSVLGEAVGQAANDISDKLAIESAPAVVNINGEDVDVTRMRVAMSTEAIISFYDELLDALESNTDLQGAVATIVDAFSTLAAEYTGGKEGDAVPSGEEAVQMILENLDDVKQSLTDALNEAAVSVAFTVCLAGEEQLPVELTAEITSGEQTVSGTFTMSPAIDFIRLEAVDSDGSATAVQFDITENSDAALGFHVGSYKSETELFSLNYRQDKAEQTFEVTLAQAAGYDEETETFSGTVSTSVSGYYAVTDTLLALTIDKVDGQEFGGTLTLNIRTDDTVTLPDFTELTKLKEAEFADVIQALSDGFDSLNALFGGTVDPDAA